MYQQKNAAEGVRGDGGAGKTEGSAVDFFDLLKMYGNAIIRM
jgi:hypothetical protein